MKITWLGHSCFIVESQGYQIVLDPYRDGSVPGFAPVRVEADQVLCSHGHGDHSGTECVSLRQGAASPFTVETIDTWHDDKNGAKRGPNTIHILSDGQCRIAHLGDLGCGLTSGQKDKLRRLTALLIPVGGFFTINAAQAKALVDELAPTVAIPMHYRGRGFGYPVIGKVDKFTKLCGNVITYPSSELELTPQTSRQTAVLKPKNT
ncbi:MAG: MBL fold metallo-hydrolase [Oscillospiraceae bacterium]|nr:MBL fold metallo-hydrolase [Oscillospiraceae bacterium]